MSDPTPFTESEALAYIDGLRAALAAERARADAAERRLAERDRRLETIWALADERHSLPDTLFEAWRLLGQIEAIAKGE